MLFGFLAGCIGGFLSLLIRLQLIAPNNLFIVGEVYNSIFTLHGIVMLYFMVMPVLFGGFGYWLIPLHINMRDQKVSFLAINAVICIILAFIFVLISFFIDDGIGVSWTLMPPLSIVNTSLGIDILLIGIMLFAISFILNASNFIILILDVNKGALFNLSIFTWSILISSCLSILALPVLFSVVVMLFCDRNFDTGIFMYSADPLLYKHLFWFFGHPEVYLVILPCFGIVTHIITVFSNKKLYGYTTMIGSMVLIGIVGFIVWAHHMFSSGLSIMALMFFTLSSIFVAIPSGLEIFSWLMTMWGGRIILATPMLFALGFIILITIGGVTGIVLSHAIVNNVFHGSYFVVAHFHYILSLGSVYAIMAGFYYWSSLFLGRQYNEFWGKVHFWTFFIANNITFFPQHFLYKMPRHVFTYNIDLWSLNLLSSIGAIFGILSMLIFIVNFSYVLYRCFCDAKVYDGVKKINDHHIDNDVKIECINKFSPWDFDKGEEWKIFYRS
ncbi:MAG: cbb3-type cytochrome c oxidase subunit I [Pseudomonadota bacterium]